MLTLAYQRYLSNENIDTSGARIMTVTKIALITGGSRGLGRSSARHLAEAGVDVLLTYHRNEEQARAAVAEVEAAGSRAAALRLDTSTTVGIPRFVDQVRATLGDQFDRDTFDYLVNNAGTGLHRPLLETTEEEFDQVMNIHLKSVFFLTQALAPMIVDGGKILLTSTGLTRFGQPGSGAYASMKGAVEVLARYLALELGGRGITANAIAPGAIATDFSGGRVRDDRELNEAIAAATALGRVGLPDDVGAAVAALLTGGTGWVTGQRIEISGGQRL